ncbi:hypothetical protein LINGRAHAP2_LOCUS22688 [Linum grandiflorum]
MQPRIPHKLPVVALAQYPLILANPNKESGARCELLLYHITLAMLIILALLLAMQLCMLIYYSQVCLRTCFLKCMHMNMLPYLRTHKFKCWNASRMYHLLSNMHPSVASQWACALFSYKHMGLSSFFFVSKLTLVVFSFVFVFFGSMVDLVSMFIFQQVQIFIIE